MTVYLDPTENDTRLEPAAMSTRDSDTGCPRSRLRKLELTRWSQRPEG